MKAILISIKPEWVAKILNGEKTIEIRRTAPKCGLPIDVYIYCTKGGDILYAPNGYNEHYWTQKHGPLKWDLRGKVVAKFMLRKITVVAYDSGSFYTDENCSIGEVLEHSCLNQHELLDYMKKGQMYLEDIDDVLATSAWHISDLVIFDKPKPLCHFFSQPKKINGLYGPEMVNVSLDKAPQSWQYIEVEDD